MTDRKGFVVNRPEQVGPDGADAQAWSSKRDAARTIIRDEVYRMNPIDEARRSLELIVEASARYVERDGRIDIVIVDDDGHPRTAVRNGEVHAFTIRDLLEELRVKHPRLFREPPGPAPSSTREERRQAASPLATRPRDVLNVGYASPTPDEGTPTTPPQRDWLNVAKPAEEPKTAPAEEPRAAPAEEPRAAVVSRLQRLSERRSVEPDTPIPQPLLRRTAAMAPPPEVTRSRPGTVAPQPVPAPTVPLDFQYEDGSEISPRAARRLMVGLGAGGALAILLVAGFLALSDGPEQVPEIPAVASNAAPPPDPSADEPGTTTSLGSPQLAEPSAPTAVPTPSPAPAPAQEAETAAVPAEPSPAPPQAPTPAPTQDAAARGAGPLRGVPQVLDTATLFLDGRIVQLFGVE